MPAAGNYDLSYIEKLAHIGLELCEKYRGAKQHHKLKCTICGHTFEATPIAKLSAFKKHNKGGCPHCFEVEKQKRFLVARIENIQKLSERFEILSDWDGRVVIDVSNQPINVNVRNKQCGHTFTSEAKNLLARNVNCPICNAARKRAAFQQFNIDRSIEYHKNAPAWDSYKDTVYLLTSKAYNKYKHIINPNNLPRGLAGTPGAYQVDHVVPVRYCFDNNIPASICAHYTNLQMLSWEDNLTTRHNLKENVEIPSIFHPYI